MGVRKKPITVKKATKKAVTKKVKRKSPGSKKEVSQATRVKIAALPELNIFTDVSCEPFFLTKQEIEDIDPEKPYEPGQGLTPQEKTVCRVFIKTGYRIGLTAKEMYGEHTTVTAERVRYVLINPNAKRYISYLKENVEESSGINRAMIVNRLMCQAFVDLNDILQPNGSPKPINEIPPHARAAIKNIIKKQMKTKSGFKADMLKIYLTDQNKAMEMLINILGYGPNMSNGLPEPLLKDNGNNAGNVHRSLTISLKDDTEIKLKVE